MTASGPEPAVAFKPSPKPVSTSRECEECFRVILAVMAGFIYRSMAQRRRDLPRFAQLDS
jgi:hypothetical protein